MRLWLRMDRLIKWVEFPPLGDDRGSLVALEANVTIPFDIKRVYCMYGMDSKSRGFHAHIALQQVMVCLSGECNVLFDNGLEKKNINMKPENKGLFIDKMIWHEMHDFSKDCVLMVLASEWYYEDDYIRDYDDFSNLLVAL